MFRDIFWKIKQVFCIHTWDFFTEYDEYDGKNCYHYVIYQCKNCDKVKIERRYIR